MRTRGASLAIFGHSCHTQDPIHNNSFTEIALTNISKPFFGAKLCYYMKVGLPKGAFITSSLTTLSQSLLEKYNHQKEHAVYMCVYPGGLYQ